MVLLLVWQSSAQTWAELHERAFRRLGGTVFQTSEVAKGLALHPSGPVYYASGDVYSLDEGKARRLDIENVRNAQALAITPQGELYVASYDGGTVAHIKPGVPSPLRLF